MNINPDIVSIGIYDKDEIKDRNAMIGRCYGNVLFLSWE